MSEIAEEQFDLNRLVFAIRKRAPLIASIIGAFIGLATLYLLITPSKFTAETKVFIDPKQIGVTEDITASADNQSLANPSLESQIEIIKSGKILTDVLEKNRPLGYFDDLPEEIVESDERLGRVVSRALQVRREGETYIINIAYTAKDPVIAAALANDFADFYIKEQVEASNSSSGRGADWLSGRLEELKIKVDKSNEAVQKFRVENNIFSATGGRLISEDQLVTINDQLGVARADIATTKARYEHSRSLIKKRDTDAAMAEALDNDVINTIRTSYLKTKKRHYELSRLLGSSHYTVMNLKKEISEYERLIFSEMERIAQTELSQYQIAKARAKALEKSLSDLIGVKADNDALQSQLTNLERQAETYQNLYKEYLEKFESLSQRSTLSLSGTRVISEASPPLDKSHPKTALILALAIVVGSGFALIVAIFAESRDRSLRTVQNVRRRLGLSCLGLFPRKEQKDPEPSEPVKFDLTRQGFYFTDELKNIGLENPLSIYADTLKKTKSYIDIAKQDRQCAVISIVSADANEGKSSVSANLANYIASSGARCLLADFDVRNPMLRPEDFKHHIVGVGDCLEDGQFNVERFIRDKNSGLYILPAVGGNSAHIARLLSRDNANALLQSLSDYFDYIIVDCPPLSVTNDVNVISGAMDGFVVVSEWGKTGYDYINDCLLNNNISKDKVLGVILNKADMRIMYKLYNFKSYYQYQPAPDDEISHKKTSFGFKKSLNNIFVKANKSKESQ